MNENLTDMISRDLFQSELQRYNGINIAIGLHAMAINRLLYRGSTRSRHHNHSFPIIVGKKMELFSKFSSYSITSHDCLLFSIH